ncbi:ribulokinase [Paraburkholderia megapolitana]|uniref:L-ribulokinase n=1 Tax=Paraburkholderia megapolitana TaxID=420953 RepID=A0A1I3GQH1_9BURK|nr:ribulokinase [Paraburkholderia megapolitana]QDQ83007.1 ribulokinase [Paraburkholderia megapolitana]SFI25666.1 L-ribulokinase [Paraburkholderia megapolitana]
MTETYIVGLDYGTSSARGVLLDAATGEQIGSHMHAYRHDVMTRSLPDGTPLPRAWALQNAADYLEAAQEILSKLGRGRNIASIGLGFSASSPMPARQDGTALSELYPGEPHAYVKLWKHHAAQPYADEINRRGGSFLRNFGGKLSGEWLLPKAAQIADEAPHIWDATDRFIESGDWLVWQLTGTEARSLGFAAYKAQYSAMDGYPHGIVPGLTDKLAEPHRIGSAAGSLSEGWRQLTGISGNAVVAVAVIDSHVVLPAAGAVSNGCLVGALGTSAAYLLLNERFQPLPPGIEGVAKDGSIRDLWCYEAGQAGFGDTLGWFVNAFPRGADSAESFRHYNREAAQLEPGANHLVALDWWNGNRVPLADSSLSGLLVGLTTNTTAVDIYRALIESLCFGARAIVDLFESGGLAINRVVLTSGLAQNNPFLVQTMADVLGREVEVPDIAHATAVGAAIHGAVAAGLVAGFVAGSAKFGAQRFERFQPNPNFAVIHAEQYGQYRELSADETILHSMRVLNGLKDSLSDPACEHLALSGQEH